MRSDRLFAPKLTAIVGTLENSLHLPRIPWERILFPVVPKSPASFVNFLFWHSLIMTASMPLARLVHGRWIGVHTIEWIRSLLGLSTAAASAYPGAYLVYPQNQALDRGFSYHAFFGLLWLLLASLQMAVLATKHKQSHKVFGYIIQLSFLGHLGAAMSLLFVDTQQHHWLVKFMLMSPVLYSSTYMARGIASIRRGDVAEHIDHMVRCFVYSIEGAGTIRTVSHLFWLGGIGPTFYQDQHGATATHCVDEYLLRLIFTRLLSLYWLGCYARMRGNEKLTKSLLRELVITCVGSALAYGYALKFVQ